MAEIFQTGMASEGRGFTPFPQGTVCVRKASYELTKALVINDVIEMIPVYKDERVIDLRIIVDDLDTGGTPLIVFDVGDGVDVDRYIDGSILARTGGSAEYGSGITGAAPALALDFAYPADDTIDVIFGAAPATGATTGTVTVIAQIVHA